MTPDEYLYLLNAGGAQAGAGQAGAVPQTVPTSPLAGITAPGGAAPGTPQYRVPLRRQGGRTAFLYPGFGWDPEANPTGPAPGTGTPGGDGTPGGGGTPTTPTVPAPAVAGPRSQGPELATGLAGVAPLLAGMAIKGLPKLAGLGTPGTPEQLDAASVTTDDIPLGDDPPAPLDEGTGSSSQPPDATPERNSPEWDAGVAEGLYPDDGPWNSWLDDPNNVSTDPPALIDEGSPIFDQPASAPGGDYVDQAVSDFGAPGAPLNLAGDFGGQAVPLSDWGSGYVDSALDGQGSWDLSGIGADLGIDPSWANFGLGDTSTSIMGFDFNPVSIGAGMLGSWAGGTLANDWVEGDEQQGVASSIGGSVGGMIGTAILPGIGTLIGAFIGSLAAGTLFAGEPDIPYSWAGGRVSYGDTGPVMSWDDAGALNGANPESASRLTANLGTYLTGRAASEGYELNPERVNNLWGAAGYYKGGLFYRSSGDDYTISALNPEQIGNYGKDTARFANDVYGDLVNRGFYRKPGSGGLAWDDVKANIQGQGDHAARTDLTGISEAGNTYTDVAARDWTTNNYAAPTPADTRPRWADGSLQVMQGDVAGYETSMDGGEAGGSYQVFNAGPPPERTVAAPLPFTGPIDEGSGGMGGRYGGMIPPTPGGTQPVRDFTAHTGEFVVRPEAVEKYGPEMLTSINRGEFPAGGGAQSGDIDMVQGAEGQQGMMQEQPAYEGAHNDPWKRPYADLREQTSPFEEATANGGQPDPVQALQKLPPEMQQAMMASLGSNPMMASAWLEVLGPSFEPVIAAAMKMAAQAQQQQQQQQQMMMQQQAMGGGMAPPAPGAPPSGMM